jgi:hypothetical protein
MNKKKKTPTGEHLSGGGNPIGQSKDNTPKEAPGKDIPTLNGSSQDAVDFLDGYRKQGLMNLVAIPQEGGAPVGITRPHEFLIWNSQTGRYDFDIERFAAGVGHD